MSRKQENRTASIRAFPMSLECGHGEDQPVTLHCSYKSQRNAGIAADGLNQHGLAGLDFTGLFCGLNQCQANTVLDARCWFWLSSLATTAAPRPAVTRLSRTKGVRPMISVTSTAIRAIVFSSFRDALPDLSNELFWGCGCLVKQTGSGAKARKSGSELSPGRC